MLVSLLIAGLVSTAASGRPDGLQRVAADQGFADRERTDTVADGPFADYQAPGVEGGTALRKTPPSRAPAGQRRENQL